MAEGQTTVFVMHGAREAIAAGLYHVDQQVETLERSVFENPGLAFDLARSVVESVCRTILKERQIPFDDDADLPALFRLTTQHVPMLPPQESDAIEVRRSLSQTVNGLHTALQGVCELRNACGFASHGRASQPPSLEAVQALLAAQTADAIVGFLHRVHRGERPSPTHQRPARSPTVDSVIDLVYEPVVIAGQPYAVSEALYGTDPDAYAALALAVEESRNILGALLEKHAESVRPDILSVSFVHFDSGVYLKVIDREGKLVLEDTGFIAAQAGVPFFSPSHSPDHNAQLFVTEFDAVSIANCFDLFTAEAAAKIAEPHDPAVGLSLASGEPGDEVTA